MAFVHKTYFCLIYAVTIGHERNGLQTLRVNLSLVIEAFECGVKRGGTTPLGIFQHFPLMTLNGSC